jgi:DNA polymerase IV
VAAWLTRKGVFGRTVTLKIRYSDFTTLTRSHSAQRASQNAEAIAACAVALLARTDAGRRPVRLLGVSVHNLQEVEETAHAIATWTPGLPFDGE